MGIAMLGPKSGKAGAELTVSVVTPSYNQGEFIAETIESVLSQEGDFLIDYLIIDGGSGDESVKVIKNYDDLLAKNCRREDLEGRQVYCPLGNGFAFNRCRGISFSWVSEADKGQVDALKKGFSRAQGEIFCWLNSDDFFTGSDVLSKVVDCFQASPELQLLTADGLFVDRGGKRLGVHHVDRINQAELIYLDYHILQPSTFFRRELYSQDSLREDYVCAFDADFFIGLMQQSVNYLKTDDIFSAFRIYPEIKTNALPLRRYWEQLQIAYAYGDNCFHLLVSAVYRFFQIVIKPKFAGKPFFEKAFQALYAFSYQQITGKRGR